MTDSSKTTPAAALVAPDPAAGPVTLSGFLERVKKYTKKWGRRYCTFDSTNNKFTYSAEEKENGAVKAFLILTKVVRCAELRDGLSGADLYQMNLEGLPDGATDGKTDTWNMRFPSNEVFEQWYEVMRRSLALNGSMDPYNYGLPAIDPRQGLPFAKIPLQYLNKFGLLEKAIIYTFAMVRYPDPDATTSSAVISCPEAIFVVGDKSMYLFKPNADVLRCTSITNMLSLEYTKGVDLIGISMKPPEADIILHVNENVDHVKHVLQLQFQMLSQGKKVPVNTHPHTKLEALGEKMRMRPDDGYKMEVASPTAKARLKHALDQYEKQQGVKFDPSTARKAKRETSTGVPANSSSPSSPAGGSGTGGAGGGGLLLDPTIPLVQLLTKLDLREYAAPLLKQHVDLDVLQCMDLTDLETFGVKNKSHAQKILDAANDAGFVTSVTQAAAASVGATTASATTPAKSAATGGAPAAGASAAPVAAAASPKKPISLSSDDDDDLDVFMSSSQVGSPGAAQASRKPIIVLDDSDDDLDLLPASKLAAPAAAAAAPGSPQRAPIVLDDDDI